MTDHRKPTPRIRGTTPALEQRARELRCAPTPAEHLLWARLRRRQLNGLKFRRQHPLGRFIADFCCPVRKLVIELDGPIHVRQVERDAARTQTFEAYGYRVLRFSNVRVETDIESVLVEIATVCGEQPGPLPIVAK